MPSKAAVTAWSSADAKAVAAPVPPNHSNSTAVVESSSATH